MSKTQHWITILLALLLVLALVRFNIANKSDIHANTIKAVFPTYQSDYSNILVYSSEGILNYSLVAKHVEYFSDEGVSWFNQPVMTVFGNDKVEKWLLKSDRAKLTDDYMLYLYGHVEGNNLSSGPQLQKITMDNAQINLVTQDIISQDLVTFHSTRFHSRGLRMRGNLRNKNAELIEQVKTSYGI